MITEIGIVISYKWPGNQWSCHGTYETLDWSPQNSRVKPTKKEIQEAWNEYTLYQQSIAYKQLRAIKYPPLTDQLDMLWHAMESGEIPKANEFYTAIEAVKTQYPKES